MTETAVGCSSDAPIRVMMATTSWPHDDQDWRGRFIFDLQSALSAREELELSIWAPPGVTPGGAKTVTNPREDAWLRRMSDHGGIAHMLRANPVSGVFYALGILKRLRAAAQREQVDIYHVNWLQLALGLPADGQPALVSVLGSDFGLLRLPGMTKLLRRAFSERRTLLAPNAEWMVEPLHQCFGDVAEVRAIPFGVDASWFQVDRPKFDGVRDWLVVSRITRKKLGALCAWGEGLFGKNRPLLLLGPQQEVFDLPSWIMQRGATNPQVLREVHFPGVAGLVTLSHHDEGRPQVMIEAMAAGLPVIASRLAAHSDLILHGKTGWLVSSRDEFECALEEAENLEVASLIGRQAQTWIREYIGTWDDCASRYLQAYRDLLESHP